MSYPSTTYGKGLGWTDCDDKTGYAKVDSADPLTGPSQTVENGDYFKIGGTCDNAADEWVYYKKVITGISSSTYNKFMVRWKTDTAASFGAKVSALVGGVEKFLLGTATVPVFTPTSAFTVTSGTVPGSGNITEIRFWMDDYPNTVAAGSGYAYYDFLMFYEGTFGFPNGNVRLLLPDSYVPQLHPPGRAGDIQQNLGSGMTEVHITSDLDQGSWGTPVAQRIYQIDHEQPSQLWQWLTLQQGCAFKAYISQKPDIAFVDGKKSLDLWLTEYKLAPTTAIETYAERFGH